MQGAIMQGDLQKFVLVAILW